MTILAQGGTGSPPAGGGEIGQVIGGTVGAMIVTAAMFYLVLGHRSGRVKLLSRLGLFSERVAGLPPWSALPLGILSSALLIAVFGMYWDIATHLDAGRDPGPFANAAHYFILVGLFLIFFAGLVAIFLPTEKPGPTAIRLPGGLQAPLGGILILVCSGVALAGFPLDDMWHRIFGQDVTLWGPTHLLLFGGASLSTLGAMILLMEGASAAREVRPQRVTRRVRLQQVLLGGAFLIGLSTFQGEFDYSVPQFRLVFHPILLMLASSVALVAVRVWAGKGAAIGAALFFILIRGTLTLLVSPLFGHTLLHFPLYLVEAVVVEAVALRVARDKPLTLGLLAGIGIGTLGLAAEWAWSFAWWTIEWPASMLVEGVICGFVAAVAGGVTGAFIGRALSSPEIAPQPVPRFALPAAVVAIVALLVYATPITAGDPVKASVTLTDAKPPPNREVNLQVKLDPPGAADERLLVRPDRLAGQGGALGRLEAEEGRARHLPQHRAAAGARQLEDDAAPAQGLRRRRPADLLPRGQGDPGQGHARAEAVHAHVRARQEEPPARAEAGRLTDPERRRLPRRAGDLRVPLRLHGLGPGAAPAAAGRQAQAACCLAGG